MTLETVRDILGWCTVINFGILAIWAVAFLVGRDWIYGIWRRRCRLTDEQFDMLSFLSFAFYKLGIFLFNLVPYLAMTIVS
jgi:hypothetical protein